MTGADDDRATLQARNAAIKEQVNGLLDKFHQQTALLEQAQSAASSATATVTSPDGLVTATVDATGTITELEFASKNFQRTDPKQLARTVRETVHAASAQVKKQMADLVAPVTEDLPDLPDLIDGAPSLKGLLPEMPDLSEPSAPAQPPRLESAPQSRLPRRRPVDDDPDDDAPDSWLVGGQGR
ncbi:YbaB/EbfC family nucleoid-associated protein [Saccharopolyspora flava]|uniref:Conserved DNA-binding protein YbaB n=1 Tax=Saccharopolyspora flava TaxID=95161 RepID=A0A1I6TVF6_9PSEU|nr:YbaB/EbfC family nucleoid-associated protein [Saccharopolyspora flava]SFS93145.1 Conserved DNA-binding protein YbaB [Saccharopolyspora flava]